MSTFATLTGLPYPVKVKWMYLLNKHNKIEWSKKFQDDYYRNNGSNQPGTSNHGNTVQACGGVCWRPPGGDEYKTNCGTFVDDKKGRVGIGIIIRNSKGEVLACSSQIMEANLRDRIANVLAVQRCIHFGLECGLNSTKIESDEATVINWINCGSHRDTDFGLILSDIDVMKADISGITFSHIPSSANKAALSLAKIAMGIAEDSYQAC
ncbi:hypothetical protein LWI29_012248 [Acer saccharum]|uniref:RNase H type-1 domain-containing protein n=1 Tax=Acer saccharum TaxID=4024 RepID=A0AA39SLZ9_ACESA|nr:hypothetical protein LWI29_012248 [Acer saccharum]